MPDFLTALPSIDFAKNVESVTFLEYKDESKTILKELGAEEKEECDENDESKEDNNES